MKVFGLFFGVTVLFFANQSVTRAEGEFVKLSKNPASCQGGIPNKDANFWFGGETLAIEMEEQAATSNLELARKEFSLYQRTRDISILEKSKTDARQAALQLQKKLDERFEMADVALAAGCLGLADQGYRDIIKTHTGTDFQAARDRAKVGIDDVRAKQSK